jgi:hypothetical protein
MALHKDFPQSPHAILDPRSRFHECTPGRRKIAVKVVDIFGNDTMTIVDVLSVGKNEGKK